VVLLPEAPGGLPGEFAEPVVAAEPPLTSPVLWSTQPVCDCVPDRIPGEDPCCVCVCVCAAAAIMLLARNSAASKDRFPLLVMTISSPCTAPAGQCGN